jgi:hypothetical protein
MNVHAGLSSLQVKMTPRPSSDLERVFDAALVELQPFLMQVTTDQTGPAERNASLPMLFRLVDSWRNRVDAEQRKSETLPDTVATDWIRSTHGSFPREVEHRILLVLCVRGVAWITPVIKRTNDDDFACSLYGALQKYVAIFGIQLSDSRDVLECLLSDGNSHYTVEYYVAYIKLLGQLLEGAAARAYSQPFAGAESNYTSCSLRLDASGCDPSRQTLLDRAVAKVLDIAGWWHRNHFHEECSAELLSHAFGTLLQIFKEAPSLLLWEPNICQQTRWVIYNYEKINSTLEFAKRLLHMGGRHAE